MATEPGDDDESHHREDAVPMSGPIPPRRDPAHFDTPRNRLLLAFSAAGLAARRAVAAIGRGIAGAFTVPRKRG
jgi:hypothetical protein